MAEEGCQRKGNQKNVNEMSMKNRLRLIQAALHAHTSLATVLQDVVISFLRRGRTLLVADVGANVICAVSLEKNSVRTLFPSVSQISQPCTLAVHTPSYSLLVGERIGNCIHRMSLHDGSTSVFSGQRGVCGYTEGVGSNAHYSGLEGIAVVGATVIACDEFNHRIRCVPLDGTTSALVAGGDTPGFLDGKGEAARFNCPTSVVADRTGTLFVADYNNHAIRRIDTSGVVTTLAGSGNQGHVDGPGNQAQFNWPNDLTLDREQTYLLVTDTWNFCLRRVNLRTGAVSTFAGHPSRRGHVDGPASDAAFNRLRSLVCDPDTGNVFVCDDNRIRKVCVKGVVSTMALTAECDRTALFDCATGLTLLH